MLRYSYASLKYFGYAAFEYIECLPGRRKSDSIFTDHCEELVRFGKVTTVYPHRRIQICQRG